MGLFRLDSNDFFFLTRSRGEVLAFSTNKRGRELVSAIIGYQIYPDINGWTPEEVVNELVSSGLLSKEDVFEKNNCNVEVKFLPEFLEIKIGKNGSWWEHTASKTAKYFDRRVFEHHSAEWSDDQWHGRSSSGWKRVAYREWTANDVESDFKENTSTWKPYRIEYDNAFRQNKIIFEK